MVQFAGDLAAVAAQRLGAAVVAGVAHSPSCPWLRKTHPMIEAHLAAAEQTAALVRKAGERT